MKHIVMFAALAALCGCFVVEDRLADDPAPLPESAALAVLALGTDGADVVLLDVDGFEIGREWTGLGAADALVWDEHNQRFVVRQGGKVRVVVPGGARWTLADVGESDAHGMGVAQDGQVFVAIEGSLMRLHGRSAEEVSDESRCFWDVVSDGADKALSIDVMTGTVTRWDTDDGSVQNLFTYTDEPECWHEPGVVGRDDRGGVWVARTSNGAITLYDGPLAAQGNATGDEADLTSMPAARTVARLSHHVPAAEQAIAVAAAGERSVHVLYSGLSGDGIVKVDANGGVELVAETDREIWTDLVSLR